MIIAEPSVPSFLLEGILESQLPLSPMQANVSGDSDTMTLHSAMQDLLALQLQVFVAYFNSTVHNINAMPYFCIMNRYQGPLLRIFGFLVWRSQSDHSYRYIYYQVLTALAIFCIIP